MSGAAGLPVLPQLLSHRASALQCWRALAPSLPVSVFSKHPDLISFSPSAEGCSHPASCWGVSKAGNKGGWERHPWPVLISGPCQPCSWQGARSSGSVLLPGLSREAGNRLHRIRAVTAEVGWHRDVSTWCEKEDRAVPREPSPHPRLIYREFFGGLNPSNHSGSTRARSSTCSQAELGLSLGLAHSRDKNWVDEVGGIEGACCALPRA